MPLKSSSSASTYIKDGWFSEIEAMWPGQRFSLKVDNLIENGKSEYQDILVFQTETYGKCLVLDGVIQLTERDEHGYQEMITHLPIFSCRNPKKVLIVGGGDGGVLREVCRHKDIETIHMCEIDAGVIEVAKQHFSSSTATSFDDPRVTLMIEDAAKYLKGPGKDEQYDIIICDSSDPVGPAEVLFEISFFESMRDALSPSGVLCTQGECLWLHLELIKRVIDDAKSLMPSVKYAYTTVPSYPSGQIGFVIASKDATLDLSKPSRKPTPEMEEQLRYYTNELHSAAFILPAFAKKVLG